MHDRYAAARAFQPTPSARRVTDNSPAATTDHIISTHTLRKEGDRWNGLPETIPAHFNPHPPQGG